MQFYQTSFKLRFKIALRFLQDRGCKLNETAAGYQIILPSGRELWSDLPPAIYNQQGVIQLALQTLRLERISGMHFKKNI